MILPHIVFDNTLLRGNPNSNCLGFIRFILICLQRGEYFSSSMEATRPKYSKTRKMKNEQRKLRHNVCWCHIIANITCRLQGANNKLLVKTITMKPKFGLCQCTYSDYLKWEAFVLWELNQENRYSVIAHHCLYLMIKASWSKAHEEILNTLSLNAYKGWKNIIPNF